VLKPNGRQRWILGRAFTKVKFTIEQRRLPVAHNKADKTRGSKTQMNKKMGAKILCNCTVMGYLLKLYSAPISKWQ